MNIVEIIIKAITDDAQKGIKETDSNLKKLQQTAQQAGKVFNVLAKTISAVGLGFLAALRFLQDFGKTAEELNFGKSAQQVKFLNQSLDDAKTALLEFNIGGRQVQEWLGRAAEAMGYLIRIIEVLTAVAIGGALIGLNELHVAFSSASVAAADFAINLSESLGLISHADAETKRAAVAMDQYTQAMANADNALIDLAVKSNVALAATIGLTNGIKATGRSLTGIQNSQGKNLNSLKGMIAANKALNDQYSKRKSMEDAIRAGDARALADALYGGGGGSGGGGRGGGQVFKQGGEARGSVGQGKPPTVIVNVSVGNKQLNPHINKQVSKVVFGGGTGKSDASKHPGKDQ